ncbi:hypothetical protein K491DRAFT_429105 [Lophiostoma macrostomum CBS 122681]|uniref:Uncharacterized protein n=1 Tax=Lophiostoma macrostomum CBS 122681 TaxID=1314788 RepID=A0A6A6TA62_9PLEO|nr:hypothetical protein K491DRAFT_429105 [Lophiostoma macrostomum CBS 122681]
MAKRKRAEQLEILNETAEAYHAAKRARPAPQAAPHRRGGTHGVKDEHMTGSKWDQVDRKGLLEALKARRNRGIWKKDLPKHEMARRLAEDDRRQELATRRLEQETIERVNELKKRKAKEIEEKARRKAEKQKRRDYGEDVSSDSEDRPQENQFGVGEILSDSSLDKLSESTTITSPTLIPPMYPHERLRIFEWSHAEPPSEDPPEEIFSPSGRMKLITTLTGETLELPGRQYPEEIGQDFVPKLSQYMMNCARNGIMVGALRKAVIEPAQDWAQRTHVQYWNGRMYLELPGRTSTLSLPEVFTKWEHKKKAQRYVPKGTIVKRKTRAEKLQHHKREKKQKMFDIFASSEYRPPICYAPVDLDYPNVYTDDEGPRELDNLYYVRFPGMDLPHYYFWTRRYEWADPTVPNPNWMSAKIQDEALEREEELQRGKELNEEANRPHVRPGYKEDTSRPYILKTSKMRAKKTSTPCKFQPGQKRLPKTSKFKAALWAVERELYQNGLQTVLYKYRDAWMDEGKEQTWRLLSENLPKLYPSGRMPEAPPVHEDDVPSSVAEKIASMEAPNPSRPVSPLRGDEPWTRDDDEYWNVVDAPPRRVSEADIQRELLRSMSVVGRRYPRRQSALYRRASEGLYGTTDEYAPGLTGWLHGTSPSYTSSQWEDDNLPSNDSIGYREYERLLWEHRFEAFAAENTTLDGEQDLRTAYMLRRGSSNPPLPAHLDAMPISELKWKISNLRNPSLDHGEQCRLCLEPLDKTDVTSVYEHYQKHHDDSSHRCPFCDMTWGKLDSTWKASHVLSHDFDDSIHRRRLSSVKPSVYYSIPVPNRTTSQRLSQIAARSSKRRPSKVSFSPKIVEKRIAYNDQDEDEGVDADVDTLPPTSPGPRRSSLKFRNASGTPSNRSSKGLARKSSLKVNTSVAKPGVAKMATGAKLLKPTAEHKVQPTNPNGNRGKDTRPVDSWTILHSLPMPSDLTPSPEVMPVSKRRRGEADPTWDPRGQSPSDHIKSPYLPHVVHYSRDHPDGTYNPRRWSKSTAETLEYHTGGRKPKPKKAAMKATSHTTRSKTRSAGKGKAKQIDEEELPSTSSSRALKRSYSDFEYTQPAPSTKPSSYHRPKYRKVKTKTIDTTYQDIAPSSPSSGSKSPVLYKRKKAADATYRNISDSESTTTAHSTKKVKKTTKTPRGCRL